MMLEGKKNIDYLNGLATCEFAVPILYISLFMPQSNGQTHHSLNVPSIHYFIRS